MSHNEKSRLEIAAGVDEHGTAEYYFKLLMKKPKKEVIKNNPSKIFKEVVRSNSREAPYYFRNIEKEFLIKK